MHLRVVVEVHGDQPHAGRGGPAAHPLGPGVQLLGRVPAGVQLLRPVQPHVHVVGRHDVELGPAAGTVGHDHGDVQVAAERGEPGVAERLVPDLEGVPQRPGGPSGCGPPPGRLVEPVADEVVGGPGQPRRLALGARQPAQERLEHRTVERGAGGQLPQERAEVLAEQQRPGRQEPGHHRPDVTQPLQVRDQPRALHRQQHAVRHPRGPRPVRARTLQRVEGAVQLDRPDPGGGVLELEALGEAPRVVRAAPAAVRPPRQADVDAGRHARILPTAQRGTRVRPSWGTTSAAATAGTGSSRPSRSARRTRTPARRRRRTRPPRPLLRVVATARRPADRGRAPARR